MSDPGTRYADRRQEVIERRLRRIYTEATADIVKRLDRHSQKMYANDEKKRAQVAAGKLSEQEYKDWLRGQLFIEGIWQEQITEATNVLLHANEAAVRMIEGERRAVFAENANYQAYRIEKDTNMSIKFGLYDDATVTRLIRDDPQLLPPKKVDEGRDTAWNRSKISAVIARGVISGDSIQTIAENIGKETGISNEKAMTRYARTAMTAAQNAGRIEAMNEAQEMGIQVRKVWMATLDERTRPAHQELDGQTAEVNEPFSSILGPIMYPGDPSASADNTWNCRCTLGYDYKEYQKQGMQRYDQEAGEVIGDVTYNEWLQQKHPERVQAQQQAQQKAEQKAQQNTEEPKQKYAPFVPAATLADAEKFAAESFVNPDRFGAVGVSYQGIGLDAANEINGTIYDFYNMYRVDKFGGVIAPRANTKEGRLVQDAVAGYSPIRHSFILNRTWLKSLSAAEGKFKNEQVLVTSYLANPEKYVIRSKLAERILNASRTSGRSTVPENVRETVWHELGHSLEKALKGVENYGKITEGFGTWGEKISGYATSELSEYIAESFCAWNKGESIDPELVKGFEALRR